MLKSESSDKLDAENIRVQMHLQMLQSQLKGLDTEGGLTANEKVIMDLSYNFISMEVYSVDLCRDPICSRDGIQLAPSSTDTFHLDLLISCLQAAKAYLDTLLAVSATHYRLLSFVEWMRLPRVLAIICKLCIASTTYTDIHWDYRMAQEQVQVDLYLESLCYRMQSLTTFDNTSQPLPDFWILLKTLLERIRSWYLSKIRSSTEEAATASDANILPLGPATRRQVSANGYEALESAEADFSPIPRLAEMDRMMNDFESPFWASNLFDVAMGL